MPAIHLHAAGARKEYQNKVSGDFTVRSWTPARWARKIKMDSRFLLEDGKLTVMSPGIYFVYAQVNHDIIELGGFTISSLDQLSRQSGC